MPKTKLSKSIVAKIPLLEKGQIICWDSSMPGFGLRVGAQKKVYIAQKRVAGRTVRVSIGDADQIGTEQARKMAVEAIYKMTTGQDVNASKRSERSQKITLQKAFDDFLENRTLKPRTVKDYSKSMGNAFKDWRNKRVTDITRNMVSIRHKKLGREMGPAQANLHFRFLRSLLEFCVGNYENAEGEPLLGSNPVKVISQTRGWFPVDRRRTIIKDHDLPKWFEAVNEIRSHTVKDFLLLIFFTGLRPSEGMRMKWADLDFKSRTFIIPDTKNKKPLEIPMSDFVYDLFEKRKEYSKDSEYVFPSRGKTGHLTEPKKQFLAVTKKTGIKFCASDLRRIFLTCADVLEIHPNTVKMLVNHSLNSADVTQGYQVITPERLRVPMQKITNKLLSLCERSAGKLISLPVASNTKFL